MSNIPGFGKPKYGNNSSSGNFPKTFRLKEGTTTVVRILPPMKSLAESGEWAKYIGTHFGYKGVNPKDPSKPVYRTFRCIQERDLRTKMITQDCPECDLIAQREEELEAIEARAKAEGHSSDEIEELVKPHKDWLREHNLDRKWYLNVRTQEGEHGTLLLSHKTKKLLDQKILSLQTDDGIDALDLDQGVWFVFKRSGRGVETQDTVDVEYESVRDASTGRVSRTVKLAPLSPAEAERALKECPDLAKAVREISYEQIKLLTLSSGDPEDVDAIFAMGQKRESSAGRSSSTSTLKPAPAAQPVTTTAHKVAATPQVTASATSQPGDDKGMRLDTQGAPPPPAAETKAASPTSASSTAGGLPLDRAAFMARFRKQTT
jgi:hypothetical protein